MFSRSVVRAARAGKAATPSFTRVSRAGFSAAARLRDPVADRIAATEVPSTTYADGTVQKSSIHVDQELATEGGGAVLNAATYAQLPKTMKSMSLYNKVVVITGYVSQIFNKHEFKLTLFAEELVVWVTTWHKLAQRLEQRL